MNVYDNDDHYFYIVSISIYIRLISLHHLLSTKSMPGVLDGISVGSGNTGTDLSFDAGLGDNGSIEEMIKTLKIKRSHRYSKTIRT